MVRDKRILDKTKKKDEVVDDAMNATCHYLLSLGYSSLLLTNKLGEKVRRIPAHAPYPMDIEVMKDI